MKTKSKIKQADKKGKKRAGTPPWNEAVFRELADSIIDGVYCINTDGFFAFVNRSIVDRSGISCLYCARGGSNTWHAGEAR